ncbi:hypothetical protein [Consotaella salsifontis]|uniref:Uncharacterized protein n=1 Tax=Consotaella salsifontis TaxID=1365950 RepID=A0A1T4LDY8_9HYPH|nr:hypothetical protein [Consotaella salsifontis]SJZ52831.1 hypothetical protein SAMN05428963_101177 [Consotaella salsifontis]
MLVGLAIGWFFHTQVPSAAPWFDEDGPIEWIQAAIVGLAAVTLVVRAWRSRSPVGLLACGAAYFLYSAVLREVPSCTSHFYSGGGCLTHTWKYGLMTAGALLVLAYFVLQRRHLPGIFRPRWSLTFWPLLVSAALLMAAEYGERMHMMEIEETLELFSYFYALAFGWWLLRQPPNEESL